jgi:hypothetical protein
MKKFNDKKNMMTVSLDNKIELHGIFEIEKTRANFMNFLEMLGYDLSEKDLTQTNQSPNRELTVFVDGQRFIDDYFAVWISFKLSMKGSDVEIVENGEKIIKTKGSAQLTLTVYLEEDPYKKEPTDGFAKFWFALFNKFHHEHMWSDAMIAAVGDKSQAIKFFRNQVGTKL